MAIGSGLRASGLYTIAGTVATNITAKLDTPVCRSPSIESQNGPRDLQRKEGLTRDSRGSRDSRRPTTDWATDWIPPPSTTQTTTYTHYGTKVARDLQHLLNLARQADWLVDWPAAAPAAAKHTTAAFAPPEQPTFVYTALLLAQSHPLLSAMSPRYSRSGARLTPNLTLSSFTSHPPSPIQLALDTPGHRTVISRKSGDDPSTPTILAAILVYSKALFSFS
ncbi:uncharacterized protein PG986_011973 [Apiospora aurea]|uniref:Uncharacterized protein n=1 Tax=Apiospora aurea TaxID=335848 RepID=A0ABR1PYW4_9PEZI